MSHRTVSEHVMPTLVPPRTPWPRAAVFAGLRLLLGTVGRLSPGVRIGWRQGFDSGESLDQEVGMRTDEDGIFTVSVARRIGTA